MSTQFCFSRYFLYVAIHTRVDQSKDRGLCSNTSRVRYGTSRFVQQKGPISTTMSLQVLKVTDNKARREERWNKIVQAVAKIKEWRKAKKDKENLALYSNVRSTDNHDYQGDPVGKRVRFVETTFNEDGSMISQLTLSDFCAAQKQHKSRKVKEASSSDDSEEVVDPPYLCGCLDKSDFEWGDDEWSWNVEDGG